jgi:hypothetical protein
LIVSRRLVAVVGVIVIGVILLFAYVSSIRGPSGPTPPPPRPLGSTVALKDLRRGDCIDVRPDGVPADRVGTDAQVIPTVAAGKARQARCDIPHSHEVAGVTDFQNEGPYPGPTKLIAGATPACTQDADAYLGRPLEGSAYALTVGIPDPSAWAGGDRRAACLVHRADGTLSSTPMAGH